MIRVDNELEACGAFDLVTGGSISPFQLPYATRFPSAFPVVAPSVVQTPFPSSSPTSTRFVFVKKKLSWSKAQAYCRSTFGSDLATVTNEAEQGLILAGRNSKKHTWLGLKLSSELGWEWASGRIFLPHASFWQLYFGGKPPKKNKKSKEYCAMVHKRKTSRGAQSDKCKKKAYFACDAVVQTAPPTRA
jgi:hypothetical protein